MITASINKDIFQWWVHALKKKFKILSDFGHNFFKILHYQALSYDGESYDQIIHGSWQDLTIKIFAEDGWHGICLQSFDNLYCLQRKTWWTMRSNKFSITRNRDEIECYHFEGWEIIKTKFLTYDLPGESVDKSITMSHDQRLMSWSLFVGIVTIQVQVRVQSPIPKSNSKVQFKSPRLSPSLSPSQESKSKV